jgi:hypothetical protein
MRVRDARIRELSGVLLALGRARLHWRKVLRMGGGYRCLEEARRNLGPDPEESESWPRP